MDADFDSLGLPIEPTKDAWVACQAIGLSSLLRCAFMLGKVQAIWVEQKLDNKGLLLILIIPKESGGHSAYSLFLLWNQVD